MVVVVKVVRAGVAAVGEAAGDAKPILGEYRRPKVSCSGQCHEKLCRSLPGATLRSRRLREVVTMRVSEKSQGSASASAHDMFTGRNGHTQRRSCSSKAQICLS